MSKLGYIASQLRAALGDQANANNAKNVVDALRIEREHHRRKRAFAEGLAKISFALPSPGKVMSPKHVGSFAGKVTTNFLKPIGSTTAGVVNPRLSVRSAMTKSLRV